MSRFSSSFRIAGSIAIAALLSACAGGGGFVGVGSGGVGFVSGGGAGVQNDGAGVSPSTLQARLGQPSAIYPLPNGGQRLQYSQMPAGSQVWNYDFDNAGRLLNQDQALRYANFNLIVLGQTRQEDIMRMFGRPMRIVRVARFDGPIWDYRFNDINNPRIISIHIDPAGVVQRIVYTDIDRRRMFGLD